MFIPRVQRGMTNINFENLVVPHSDGHKAGKIAHKGKADKLRDGQAKKLCPHADGVKRERWMEGFIQGWAKYIPASKKKKAA